MGRNPPMVRPPWGHQSRKCCYCGKVGPRTIVAGGWAHKRCIPQERLPLRLAIEKKIAEIEADERFKMKPAAVQINAPLALIQTSLDAEHSTLRWVLKQLKEQDNG